MARNLVKITAELKKAAERVAKLATWSRPVVKPTVKSLRDRPDYGYSIKKMLRSVPPRVYEKATEGDVHVIRRQKRGRSDRRVYWFMTSTSENGVTRQHEQIITVKDGAKTLGASKDLWFDCDCKNFQFAIDYAAWKKGASRLKYSTNEPPTRTNPQMKVYPCKHLLRCCEMVLDDNL